MSRSTHHEVSKGKILITGVLLAFSLVLFSASSATAACNKFGRGKDCQQPTPAPQGFSKVNVTGDNADSGSEPLDCTSGAGNTSAGGSYACVPPTDMYLSTIRFTGIFANKNWDLCHALDSGAILHPEDFSYGWLDDCADGTCAVAVNMAFSGAGVEARTGGKADKLNVVMSTTLATEVSPDPFGPPRQKQLMVINQINLDFIKSASGRSVGTCAWYSDLSGDQITVVSFGD